MTKPTIYNRLLFFLFFDIMLISFSVYFSFYLRFEMSVPPEFIKSLFNFILLSLFIKISLFFLFKIYFIQWKFFGLRDFSKVVIASFISTIILFIVILIFQNSLFYPFPRSILFIDFFLSTFLISILRGSKRIYLEILNKQGASTLIVGADSSGEALVRKLIKSEKYNPIAFLDYDKSKVGTFIQGVKVKSYEELKKDNLDIENAIISSSNISRELLDKTYSYLKEFHIKNIKIVPKLQNRVDFNKLKDLSIEDLLARKPKDLDKEVIQNFIKDKIILITGAGGSIGSEISFQCANYGASKLILLDNSEFNLYSISEKLANFNIVSIMQSVSNIKDLEKSFKKFKPQIVIHAAAYKHVPLVEFNIDEAINNNVIGTKNTIDLSIKYKVAKFVLISTDKAVRPTNVMGATKRICELYAQNSNYNDTEIIAVRFGNVLGSSGSVIPKFKSQIENGGPITVTHKDITRYFMLIPEACELVLQAGAIGVGGEVFILDMGEPVKIVNLAKKMLELYGKEDIKIEFIGLRVGEKLYEELLIDDAEQKTRYNSIMVAKATKYNIDKLNSDIQKLIDNGSTIDKLNKIVPEFNHNSLKGQK